MGFGLIFIGYIFTVFDMGFIVNEALSVFVCKILCVCGYAVLMIGLGKYARYSSDAKRSLAAFAVLTAETLSSRWVYPPSPRSYPLSWAKAPVRDKVDSRTAAVNNL